MNTNIIADFSQRLFRLQHEWKILLKEMLERHDVSAEGWLILNSLDKAKSGLSMTQLSSEQGMKMPGVSKNVDHLSSRALVYRSRDPENRRRTIVNISEFGRELLFEINRDLQRNSPRFRQETNDDRWQDIVKYLDRA